MGAVLITTLADGVEGQPELVTVKAYVPAASPLIVLVVPVPPIPPGLIVHVPVAGRLPNTTVPVGNRQVGCVIETIEGAWGTAGTALITTFCVAGDVHPVESVTVKL